MIIIITGRRKKATVEKEKTRYSRTGPFQLEGGDSEWFINYPRPIIGKKCDETMTIF